MGRKTTHYKALMHKNWILWKRNLGGSLCELLFPVVLMAILIPIRSLIANEDVVGKHQIEENAYLTYVPDLGNPSANANFEFFDLKLGQVLYFNCLAEDAREYRSRKLIGLAGDATFITYIKSRMDQIGIFTTKEFESEDKMIEYVQSSTYDVEDDTPALCFGASAKVEGKKYSVELMFIDQGGDSPNIPEQGNEVLDIYRKDPDLASFGLYKTLGYALMQNWAANWVLEQVTGDATSFISMGITPMRSNDYVEDGFQLFLTGFFGFFLLLTYIAPIFRTTSRIVSEKETKAREGMKMMGLTDFPYWMSWLTYYVILAITISTLITIVLYINVLQNSSLIVVWLLLFLFGMANFGFVLFISAFFSSARTASLVSTGLYFTTSLLDNLAREDSQSEQIKNALSIFPVVAIYRAASNLGYYESTGTGQSFDNLGELYKNYRMSTAFTYLFLSFIIFSLLGVYLENIIQGSFGVKKGCCFCCVPSFWCGGSKKKRHSSIGDYDEAQDDSNKNLTGRADNSMRFEELSEKLKKQQQEGECLKIRKLVKKFKDKTAVNELDVTMFKDQIFALLGHNGAGKTTSISMLTGLLPATDGHAEVFGTDIFDEMSYFRTFLGVCPQHDILFDQLTPLEHLQIFTKFKNYQGDAKKEIQDMIRNIDLEESMNIQSKNLSGGQKRKLSVGIALIGGSKVVMLDEPTSGMDLTARRKLWNMLKQQKEGRILILTTHYMDEADILGDRIGIMVDGKLICNGSSLFLKTNLGVGYNLTIAKKEREADPQLMSYIESNLPGSKFVSEISGEVRYLIDQESCVHFKEFFATFDQKLESLGVLSYGLSVTTLEDVFLKVGRGDHGNDGEVKEELKKQATLQGDLEANEEFSLVKDAIHGGCAKFTQSFKALFRKRFIMAKRNYKGFIIEIFIPLLIILFGLGISKVQFFFNSPVVELKPDAFPMKQRVIFNNNNLDGASDKTSIQAINYFDREFFEPKGIEVTPGATNLETLKAFDQQIYDIAQEDPLEPYRYGSYYFHKLDSVNHEYQMITYINATSEDASAFFPYFAYEALLKLEDSSVDFEVSTKPFPVTQIQREREKGADAVAISFQLAIAFGIIPTGIIAFIVRERQLNIKHQQIISGVSLTSYWFSNYVFDLMKAFVPCAICTGLFYAFEIDIDMQWIFLMLYPFAVVPFTYVTSFMFKTESGAQNFTVNINIFFAGIGSIALYVLLLISDGTRDAGDIAVWFCRLVPSCCVTHALIFISSIPQIQRILNLEEEPTALDPNIALYDFIALIFHSIFWFFIIILIENCKGKSAQRKAKSKQKALDDDVIKEQVRITEASNENFTVKVDRLYKEFPAVKGTSVPKQAVNQISFGLEFGECFALLGVNGAGKTTTFKCLTKDEIPTEGQVQINGYNLATDFAKARTAIGYCPQFDTIFDTLTVREHLEFYSGIKGIPLDKQHALIEQQLDEMNLREYEVKQAGQLSGGNKRKLSVAMAMIGNPPIVFLDEPSTGMDPQARRFMWTVISKISTLRGKSSVILTTHSMEEAEALSTKMGIMVAGQFQCFGTAQHIKNKFGTGYEVEIKIKNYTDDEVIAFLKENNESLRKVNADEVKQLIEKLTKPDKKFLTKEFKKHKLGHDLWMEAKHEESVEIMSVANWIMTQSAGHDVVRKLHEHFPSVEMLEHYSSYFRFRVPKEDKSIGFTFGYLEDIKVECQVSEYSCSQTTLEQIFNSFASENDENKLKRLVFLKGEEYPTESGREKANTGGYQDAIREEAKE